MEVLTRFSQLALLWWVAFFAVMGLCVGSFTNVLIYRLPLGRSLSTPRWSACPLCSVRIRWYDNIPVISFLNLRGRCRQCSQPISARYPIVEMALAMIFLLLLDAFVIQGLRQGLSPHIFLSDRILADWPILLAHLLLFTCLFAMSVIDLEHYWVDVRFTYMVTGAGIILHTIWTPSYSSDWMRPGDVTGAAALAAMVGMGVAWAVLVSNPWDDDSEEEDQDSSSEDAAREQEQDIAQAEACGSEDIDGESTNMRRRYPFVWVFIAILIAMVVFATTDLTDRWSWGHLVRGLLPIGAMFVLIVSSSMVSRASDQEIADAIDEERGSARRWALEELVALLPAMIAGFGVIWVLLIDADLAQRVVQAIHWEVNIPSVDLLRHWQPLQGLSTAVSGFILAGAMGWFVRIFFTLAFGKEAMGSGDIHLMAATGCVAGWQVVAIGFFLACLMAIFGWLLVLPRKRTPAIPLGPWLAIAFLIVVIYYDSIVQWGPIAGIRQLADLLTSGDARMVLPPGIIP